MTLHIYRITKAGLVPVRSPWNGHSNNADVRLEVHYMNLNAKGERYVALTPEQAQKRTA